MVQDKIIGVDGNRAAFEELVTDTGERGLNHAWLQCQRKTKRKTQTRGEALDVNTTVLWPYGGHSRWWTQWPNTRDTAHLSLHCGDETRVYVHVTSGANVKSSGVSVTRASYCQQLRSNKCWQNQSWESQDVVSRQPPPSCFPKRHESKYPGNINIFIVFTSALSKITIIDFS